ncbi:MAG: right-handed parallel beta-helix repeat-containing protein [Kofleriaceae bacterium]
MKIIKLSVIAVITACATEPAAPAEPATSTQRSQLTSCEVPAAVPGDGIDDRAAIQAALTSQHCAHLSAGVYDIDIPSFVPPARRIYMMLLASSASLYGDGPATVLHFRGSAGGQDWQGVRLTGDGSSIHDLSIRTADITTTDEQTHAVHVLGPATNPTIYGVAFDHPQRGEPGGDCIQLVGYPTTLITGARIHNNDFTRCDRSGVAIHSGAVDLVIQDNHFHDVGDQDIDGEGSGASSGWLITRNVFDVGASPQGDMAMQLQLTVDARITDNQFNGRGIFAFQSDNLEIDHNTMTRTTGVSGTGVIELEKDCSNVNIHHNTITRQSSAGTGYVIRAVPHNSGTPDHVTIADNMLHQNATGDVVNAYGIVGLYVLRNTVTYAGASDTSFGVLANGSAGDAPIRTTDIVVAGNTWDGPIHGIIGVSGSYGGCGTVASSDNTVTGATFGLVCGNFATGSAVLGPISSTHDAWPAPVCGPPGFVTITH